MILRYSQPGDWILDQFLGSGTTLIEAKLLNRNAVGIDINPQSISLSKRNLNFKCDTKSNIYVGIGNATDLSFIKDSKIDFICTHPPYSNIIKYSLGIEGDISLLNEKKFLEAINNVASESYRVLKKGKYCAVMMGDKRFSGDVIPLGFRVMQCFLDKKFRLKEVIIKEQHNCKSTDRWLKISREFLMLAHEYIFVFYK